VIRKDLTDTLNANYNLCIDHMNPMKKHRYRYFRLFLFTALLVGCGGGEVEITPTAPVVADAPVVKTPLQEVTPLPEITSKDAPGDVPCDLPLPGMDDWTVVICDPFDDNRNEWQVETQDNPYAAYTSAVQDGKFIVEYTAKGFAGFKHSALTWFNIAESKDFVLSIKGTIDSSFKDVSWGIAFRGDEDSFFLFSIKNDGTYVFEIFENGGWIPLITPKIYNGIKLEQENTLMVEAGGQDFYFSINGVYLNQFNGAVLEGDDILLVVSAKEGVRARFTFDDIVLQK